MLDDAIMSERLILLPGWGLGSAAVQPLADALAPHMVVTIEALPDFRQTDVDIWLDSLPRDTWLGGWSLGGMLAARLAARRGSACRGLLTLASNALFVAAQDWPSAMPADTFTTFREAYASNSAATLKRFAMLCSQGGAEPRGLSRQLLVTADGSDSLAGLDLLAELDNRAALQCFTGPQLYLFATGDALVPIEAAAVLQAWFPGVTVQCIDAASHAFVVEQAAQVATAIVTFMEAQR